MRSRGAPESRRRRLRRVSARAPGGAAGVDAHDVLRDLTEGMQN